MAAWQEAPRHELYEHPFQVYVATLHRVTLSDKAIFNGLASFLPESVRRKLEGGKLSVGNAPAAGQLDPEKPTVIFFQEPVFSNGRFAAKYAPQFFELIGDKLENLKKPVLFVSFGVDGGSKGLRRGFGWSEWQPFRRRHRLSESTFVEIETHLPEDIFESVYHRSMSLQWRKRQREIYLRDENATAARRIEDWLDEKVQAVEYSSTSDTDPYDDDLPDQPDNAKSETPVDYQYWQEPPWENGDWDV
jgi:hypothetical protein